MAPRDDAIAPGGDDGALATLLARVGEWSSQDAREVPSSVVREAVLAHAELLGRLEAEAGRWFLAFERLGLPLADGARSASSWLAARTELAAQRVRPMVARTRALEHMALVGAAYAAGEIGTAKAQALVDARRRHPSLFAEHEAAVLDEVRDLTVEHACTAAARWAQLAQATREWEEAAERDRDEGTHRRQNGAEDDPDGGEGGDGGSAASDGAADPVGSAGESAASGRSASDADAPDSDSDPDVEMDGDRISPPGRAMAGEAREDERDEGAENWMWMAQTFAGRWMGRFDLDPLTGAEIDAAIDAEVDAMFAEGAFRAGDGIDLRRRRAFCLAALVRRGRRSDATCHGDPRPSVTVHIDPATLAGIPAGTVADGLARECGLADGTPLEARSIERLLCTCRLKGLWIRLRDSGEVEVRGVSDLLRDATRAQRRALRRRDGRCIFPGCSAAADWCEVHHVVPAEDLGPTLVENLVLLCRFHHHLVHEGGWRLWKAPETGRLHLVDPRRRPHPLVAHGHQIPVGDPDPPPPIPPPLRPPRFARGNGPPSKRPPPPSRR